MLKQGDLAMINFGTFFGASLDGVGMKAGEDYDYFVIPAVEPEPRHDPVPVETGPICVAESSKQKDLGLAYSEVVDDARRADRVEHRARRRAVQPEGHRQGRRCLEDLGTDGRRATSTSSFTRYFEAAPTPILNVALEAVRRLHRQPR